MRHTVIMYLIVGTSVIYLMAPDAKDIPLLWF
jgi:hypothetical protein